MADTALLTWIDANGQAWNLTDPSTYFVPAPGLQGAYGVPLGIVSYVIPSRPGDFEQYVRIDPNDVRMPLVILGATFADVERARRRLSEALRPTRGPGILRHISADGVTRDLYCREVGRMRDVASVGPTSMKVGLIFRAADPYWYDADYSSTLLKPSGSETRSFFDPTLASTGFFPIHLGSSGVSGGFTIFNGGQAETWPIFVLTGAGVAPQLTNVTTGEVLSLPDLTLTSGQRVTINTDPSNSYVQRDDGTNEWATVSSTSTLWPLAPGANEIELAMTGTDSASALELMFKARWESV